MKTETADIFEENGIIRVVYKEFAEIDIESIKSHYKTIRNNLPGWNKMPVLLEAEDFVSIDKKAKDFVRRAEMHKKIPAMAVVSNKLPLRLQANFYKSVYKPESPFKMFKQREEALKWLETFNLQ